MVRARQKPAVWWLEGNNVIPTIGGSITLSPPKQSQKHEQRARRQKQKQKSSTSGFVLLSHPTPNNILILRPPQSSTLHSTETSQSRVVNRPCDFEHLCAAVPNHHRLSSDSSPLPSPPAIRALFAFHMPLTKVGSSSGRNSPAHAGKSSHFRHPFGGRVSKHFGDMVSFLAAPRCKAHTVRPS